MVPIAVAGFRGFTRGLGRRVRALAAARGNRHPSFIQQHKIIAVVVIGMIFWLLGMSDSQTSFVCLVAAVLFLLLGPHSEEVRHDIWRVVMRCCGVAAR